MLKRFEGPLKIVCLGLAALLVWQIANVALTADPLKNLKVPELPTLAHATNIVKSTNMPPGTNVAKGSNAVVGAVTNASTPAAPVAPAAPKLPPGMTPEMLAGMPPEIVAQLMTGGGGMSFSFNGPGGPGGPGGPNKMELPPVVKSRVDTIINGELLGQVMHPMPLTLLGIAEDEAFIQATNGQSGPVKIGAEMGGVKLLRIGVNRVLVEDQGEKKELMLFGGLAGESLMPPPSPAKPANIAATNSNLNSNSISNATNKAGATNESISTKIKETP